MKTITPPITATGPVEPAPKNWTAPQAFTPFEVTCDRQTCQARLLVDSPEDILYRPWITFYAGAVAYRLVVTCPHCSVFVHLETYPFPGNPVGQPTPSVPPSWSHCIPDAVRSRAYKRWETAQTPQFWRDFFDLRDLRYWAEDHPRPARKMKARLLPPN